MKTNESHAVVIGGSMAGLLAVRVLADRFAWVTVVERDRFPLAPGARKGVPQARHAHVLLVRGGHVLEALFPGLAAELAGVGRDYPPTDEDGFLAFARGLADPILHEAIREAEPLSPIHGYRRTENWLRHFEEMRRRPERFVVLGDAACAFNPVYGQGMTVAALGALALGQALDAQRSGDMVGLAGRFQRRLARAVATNDYHSTPLLRYLSFLFKSIFAANHRWAMAGGRKARAWSWPDVARRR